MKTRHEFLTDRMVHGILRGSNSLLRGVIPRSLTWGVYILGVSAPMWFLFGFSRRTRQHLFPSGLRRGSTSALAHYRSRTKTCTIEILVSTTSVTLLREKRVGDACDIEPLLAERSD